jgi:hypothetical protein
MRESSLRLEVGESSGRIGSSQLSKKITKGWCLEVLKGGVASLRCRRVSSAEKYLVKFAGIVQEETDDWNYLRRIHEITRAIKYCKEAGMLRRAFLKRKLRRNQGHRIQVIQGRWIARKRRVAKWRVDQSRPSGEDRWQRSRELEGLRGESPKVGYSRLRMVKSRKGEKFRCGTAWTMCQNSVVRCLGTLEVQVSIVEETTFQGEKWKSVNWSVRNTWQNCKVDPWNRQADTCCPLKGVNTPLTFRVSGVRKIRGHKSNLLTSEVVKGEKC